MAGDYFRDLQQADHEIAAVIPAAAPYVLIDQDEWRGRLTRGGSALPFTQYDGAYWGPPPDEQTAVDEFEELHAEGARFAVIGSPAFWWLDYYAGFNKHLTSTYPCLLRNRRLVVFDLRSRLPGGTGALRPTEGPRSLKVDVGGTSVSFSLDDPYSRRLFLPRRAGGLCYEAPVTEVFMRCLEGARCFADVGANVGWYSCLAARCMSQGSAVYAFEMDRCNYDILTRNLRLNGCTNVCTICAAVSDQPGTVSYRRNSAGPSTMHRLVADPGADLVQVEAITLDAFFVCEGATPDLIKIDVEGAEGLVLAGMERILRTGPRLLLEIHPYHLPQFGTSVNALLSVLSSAGYRLFEIPEIRGAEALPLRKVRNTEAFEGNAMLLATREDVPQGVGCIEGR